MRYYHGHAKVNGKTKTYIVWKNMRARCLNPKNPAYADYGGRGISICERWNDYGNFLFDMGETSPGLEIERMDNSKGYCPENCRWATHTEQVRNTRRNVIITINGKTMCATEWDRYAGLSGWVVTRRYRNGVRGEALLIGRRGPRKKKPKE